MTKALSYVTTLVLAQPAELTNREVADKLGVDIERVKGIRRYHGVAFKKTPRDRGMAAKIQAAGNEPSRAVAARLGCHDSYVRAVRARMMKGAGNETK